MFIIRLIQSSQCHTLVQRVLQHYKTKQTPPLVFILAPTSLLPQTIHCHRMCVFGLLRSHQKGVHLDILHLFDSIHDDNIEETIISIIESILNQNNCF